MRAPTSPAGGSVRHVALSICLAALSLAFAPVHADDAGQNLMHLLGYVGVDYPGTVSQGRVTDVAEYAEQREFAGRVRTLVARLPAAPEKSALEGHAADLARLIERKAPGKDVATLTETMRATLARAYRVTVAPRRAPNVASAAGLYQEHCALCHGASGAGDGKLAAGLDPTPADFHDRARQNQRSVYALYNAISLGVEGTAMSAYPQLRDDERWALAFHVANLLASADERSRGALLWSQAQYRERFGELRDVTEMTPAQAAAELGDDGPLVLAYLRGAPAALTAKESPLVFAARTLDASVAQYRAGQYEPAYQLAITAYLEGFELAESGLAAVKPELKQSVEREMFAFRNMIKSRQPEQIVAAQRDAIQTLLSQARRHLDGASLGAGVAYTSSLVILLREGLEAILLLAVVVAFLIKTGRRDALKYIHIGWAVALLLGIATWVVATYAIDISGASRELTEGITALLAAAILLYVGFWLHNKLQARRWKEFIETRLHGALNDGALWSIALVAFIAVYREVFETVLFYQTLWIQAGSSGQNMVLMGFLSAAALLVALAWLIFRFSVRLPLRLFFGINSALLYVLAVVFAGKGVAALQEAGKLPISSIRFPTIDVLGIYPSLQTLGLQAMLILAAVVFVVVSKRSERLRCE